MLQRLLNASMARLPQAAAGSGLARACFARRLRRTVCADPLPLRRHRRARCGPFREKKPGYICFVRVPLAVKSGSSCTLRSVPSDWSVRIPDVPTPVWHSASSCALFTALKV